MSDLVKVISLVAFIVMMVFAIRLMREAVSSTRRQRRWLMWSASTWIVAFLVSMFLPGTAPAADAAPGSDGSAQMSVAGYEQTWTKGYSRTTCREFADDMTSSQQFAAAADMLTLVWMKIEDTELFPGDSLIEQYRDEVARHCDIPTETIAQVAWGVWITDPRFSA